LNGEVFSRRYEENLVKVLHSVPFETLGKALDELLAAYKNRRRVFIVGNGGSAATASHMASDFLWGLVQAGLPGMRAIALTDNVSLLTAISNDSSYEKIFAVQLEVLADAHDVLLIVSASGNSPSVVRAVEAARRKSMRVLAFLGRGGGKVASLADIAVIVPSEDYGPIEDLHMSFDHLCLAYIRESSEKRAAVFLDRDGVIIRDVDGLERADQIEILPGVCKAIARMKDAGFLVIVVSNQTVVARGRLTEREVVLLEDEIERLLEEGGAIIDGFFFCPHHPNADVDDYKTNCDCRKPRPGLLLKAAREMKLDLHASIMVGDRLSDIAAGARAGCKTILVKTGKHVSIPIESPDSFIDVKPDLVVSDLKEAARFMSSGLR
jgi:D,D-heptose 1,7-bisphosphate phosphatase